MVPLFNPPPQQPADELRDNRPRTLNVPPPRFTFALPPPVKLTLLKSTIPGVTAIVPTNSRVEVEASTVPLSK